MASRLELQTELEEIMENRNVYYQPPASLKMSYPCIRYYKKGNSAVHADDKVYKHVNRYEGIVIDPNPDSEIADTIVYHFEMCSLGQGYTADNLNHFPFTLYY